MFSQHAQGSGSVSITVDCWTGVPTNSSGISAILGILDSVRRIFRSLGESYRSLSFSSKLCENPCKGGGGEEQVAGNRSGLVTTHGFNLHSPSYEMGGKVIDL